MSIVN